MLCVTELSVFSATALEVLQSLAIRAISSALVIWIHLPPHEFPYRASKQLLISRLIKVLRSMWTANALVMFMSRQCQLKIYNLYFLLAFCRPC